MLKALLLILRPLGRHFDPGNGDCIGQQELERCDFYFFNSVGMLTWKVT